MVDRCRIGLYEEVPDLPTTLFVAEYGTQLLHKCTFDGSSFESVATFDNGSINNSNPSVMLDGDDVYYQPGAGSNTIYRIDKNTMTALDTDGLVNPGPRFVTSSFNDLKYVILDGNSQITGYDSNMDQVNPWIDGFIFFSNYLGFPGGERGSPRLSIKGNSAHFPTTHLYALYESFVDFEDYCVKFDPRSIIRSLDNNRCLEILAKDEAHPITIFPESPHYMVPHQSIQLYSDPDRWIYFESTNGPTLYFNEYGNPDFRAPIVFDFGIVQPFGNHNSIAVTTNDTVLFLKGTPTVGLWMLPDSLTATKDDLVEITNVSGINLGSTTAAGIAL